MDTLIDEAPHHGLDDALAAVKEESYYMKRSIEAQSIRDTMRHASNMLNELRTSSLEPRNYYELYMAVFQELQHLSLFFGDTDKHNRRLAEIYESVQHAVNVLPRMYLLITAGEAFIRSKERTSIEILKDLLEFCKGVQHPVRGLFLRYYFVQMCKNKLPDIDSPYYVDETSVEASFDILFKNMVECSRLFMRLSSNETEGRDTYSKALYREYGRNDLRVIVGASLVRMAQLEGMTKQFYVKTAAPKLFSYIADLKDGTVQHYLLDCVIQVFSDEFHLSTLDQILIIASKVLPNVDSRTILINLMRRIGQFVNNDTTLTIDRDESVFSSFMTNMKQQIDQSLGHATIDPNSIASTIDFQIGLIELVNALYPHQTEKIVQVLNHTLTIVGLIKSNHFNEHFTEKLAASLTSCLCAAMCSNCTEIITTTVFKAISEFASNLDSQHFAIGIAEAALESNQKISSKSATSALFTMVAPILSKNLEIEDDQSVERVRIVAKLVYILEGESDVETASILIAARETILDSKATSNCKYLMPPLLNRILSLVLAVQEVHSKDKNIAVTPKKCLAFIHKTCGEFTHWDPENAFALFLRAACIAGRLGDKDKNSFEAICYEFFVQALVCYEEEIADSRTQKTFINMIIGCIIQFSHILSQESYETISAKVCQHAARLIKKVDRCKTLLMCTHLYASPHHRNDQKVLDCLKKSLKTADMTLQSCGASPAIFTEILDETIVLLTEGVSSITKDFVHNLTELCIEQFEFYEHMDDEFTALQNTLNYLKTLAKGENHNQLLDFEIVKIEENLRNMSIISSRDNSDKTAIDA